MKLDPSPGIALVADRLERNLPTSASAAYRFGTVDVIVRSNSPRLIEDLDRYYSEFVSPVPAQALTVVALEAEAAELTVPLRVHTEGASSRGPKEAYADLDDGRVVHKLRTGMTFLMGAQTNLALGPCEVNFSQVVNFVNNRIIQHQLEHGSLLCHAAAVAFGERTLTIAGPSGRGKSTLSLRLLDHGLSFVSNDRLLVDRDPAGVHVHGVPKHPRINPGTVLGNPRLRHLVSEVDAAELEALDPDVLWRLERKYDAMIDECYGPGRFRLTGTLAGIVLLGWQRGKHGTEMRRVDLRARPDLLEGLMKAPGVFYRSPDGESPGVPPIPSRYVARLEGVPVYELAGAIDFDIGAELCSRLLHRIENQAFG